MVGDSADQGAISPVPSRLAGRLLVASARLADPHFFRTTVLMLEHDEGSGALGVVLNRPTEMPLGELLPGWAAAATAPAMAYRGGPVAPSSAICLAALRAPAVLQIREGVFVPLPTGHPTGGVALGTVDLDAAPAELGPALLGLRVFVGYSGWSAGQLEAEISEGGWYVVDGLPMDPFAPRPTALWHDVLARQPTPLALLASMPADPSMN